MADPFLVNDSNLKKSGFKNTVRRRKILDALENSKNKHLSAEDLYNLLKSKGEEISLATIYRVLAQFELAGIVTKHNFEDSRAVFELSEEEHHDHLICVKCGKILEFVDNIIEERKVAISKQHLFKIIDHSLSIYGECQGCQL